MIQIKFTLRMRQGMHSRECDSASHCIPSADISAEIGEETIVQFCERGKSIYYVSYSMWVSSVSLSNKRRGIKICSAGFPSSGPSALP